MKDNDTAAIQRLQFASYAPTAATEREHRDGWVDFGDDNLFPQYLIELAESSPVHGALCTSIAQRVAGDGLTGMSDLDQKKYRMDKLLDMTAADLKVHGGFYWEIIWTLDRKNIARINHLPAECMRLAYNTEDGEITGAYYSRDWANVRKKRNKPEYIPLFNKNTAHESPRQVYYAYRNCKGSEYYGKPDYWQGVNYIELARQLGMFYVNQTMNGFFPAMMIHFRNGQPEPEARRDIEGQFQNKTGARNAGFIWFTYSDPGVEPPQAQSFPVPEQEKLYQWHSDEATKQVMIAHRVTSPLLFGIRDSGGLGSNADELNQADAIFTAYVIRPDQQLIVESLESVLGITGIAIKPYTPLETIQEAPAPAAPVAMADEKKKTTLAIPDSFPVTDEMAAAAEQGLKWRDEYNRGGTEIGVARARDISNKKNLSWDTVKRMNSYFARHEVDKQATGWNQGEEGFPTAGRIAWQLWGGDPGQSWAARLVERYREEELTDAEAAEMLIALGEDAGPDWVLIDEMEVDYDSDDEENANIAALNLASTGTARPNAKSDQDRTIDDVKFYTRYKYDGRVTSNTRPFCRKMIDADKLYRKEDIMQMGKRIVNAGWGPKGADTYSIWLYKGGGNCHHFWKKQVYASAKGFGLDLTRDDIRQATKEKAAKAGYKTRNNPKVEQKPIDMPYNGFLPSNPIFGQ